MKIKNLLAIASFVLMGAFFSAFIRPSSEATTDEKKEETFESFLSHFEKIELPYQLTFDDFKNYETYKNDQEQKTTKKKSHPKKRKYVKRLERKKEIKRSPIRFTEFIPEVARGRFSRRGPPEVYPVAQFNPSEKTIAVIYVTRPNFSMGLDKTYKMIVFDMEGNWIGAPKRKKDEMFPEGNSFTLAYSSNKSTQTCSIDKDGKLMINQYDNTWKKDVSKKGYRNNQLLGFKYKETKIFEINNEGLVKASKEITSDARASLH